MALDCKFNGFSFVGSNPTPLRSFGLYKILTSERSDSIVGSAKNCKFFDMGSNPIPTLLAWGMA